MDIAVARFQASRQDCRSTKFEPCRAIWRHRQCFRLFSLAWHGWECSLLNAAGDMTRVAVSFGAFVLVFAHASAARAQQSDPQKPMSPPAPTAPSPPFANRANDVLPPWLRVRGEFRERMEGFTGAGFTSERDDLYWLSRFRFNATVAPTRVLSFSAQAQDARVAKKSVGTTGPPFQGTFDLAGGVRRHRRSQDTVAARDRASGVGVRRATPYRTSRLDQYRTYVRCGPRHNPQPALSDRPLRRLCRSDSRRRVRQERQWESTFRGLRIECGDRPASHDRALYVLEEGHQHSDGAQHDGQLECGDDRRALGRQAPGTH